MSTLPNTALLVIDVQKGLFEKPVPIYKASQMLANIRTLVERAHQANVPVIFIQHSTEKILIAGTDEWQFHPELQPTEKEMVIQKHHGNAFEDTPLQAELAARQVGRVVITGLVSHGCVKASSLGALELGYEVVVAADGHGNYHKKAQQIIDEVNQAVSQAGAQLALAKDIKF